MNVYWAPVFHDNERDWNLLYYDLQNLTSYLTPLRNKNIAEEDKLGTFFHCPASRNVFGNTYWIENPIETHSEFIKREDGGYDKVNHSKTGLNTWLERDGSLENNLLVTYNMRYIFFADEDLEMMLTSPYFHNTNHKFSVCPARFNINKWFRVVMLEYNLWSDNEFHVKKGDPLAYINFLTSEKVTLKRFEMNDKLHKYANSMGRASEWEPFKPLIDRYRRFTKTRMNDLVLKEIKQNLIGE